MSFTCSSCYSQDPLKYFNGKDDKRKKLLSKRKKVKDFSRFWQDNHALISFHFIEKMWTNTQLVSCSTLQITESQELITLALEGLNYYHGYDRFFLGWV